MLASIQSGWFGAKFNISDNKAYNEVSSRKDPKNRFPQRRAPPINRPPTPETIVRISGEVERDWLTKEIDVERVEVMAASSQGSNQLQRHDSDQTDPIDGGQTSGRS